MFTRTENVVVGALVAVVLVASFVARPLEGIVVLGCIGLWALVIGLVRWFDA